MLGPADKQHTFLIIDMNDSPGVELEGFVTDGCLARSVPLYHLLSLLLRIPSSVSDLSEYPSFGLHSPLTFCHHMVFHVQ